MSISSVEVRRESPVLHEGADYDWPGVVPPSAEVEAEMHRRELAATQVELTSREAAALSSGEIDDLSLEEQAVLNEKVRLKQIATQVRTAIAIHDELKAADLHLR